MKFVAAAINLLPLVATLVPGASARLSRRLYHRDESRQEDAERILHEEDTRAMFRQLFGYASGSMEAEISMPNGLSMPTIMSMSMGYLSMSMPTVVPVPPASTSMEDDPTPPEKPETPPAPPTDPSETDKPTVPPPSEPKGEPDTIQAGDAPSGGSSSSAAGMTTGALVGVIVAAVAAALVVAGLVGRQVIRTNRQLSGESSLSSVASPSSDLDGPAAPSMLSP